MDSSGKTKDLSQLCFSETVIGGIRQLAGKSARSGLWASGEVTNRSTRNLAQSQIISKIDKRKLTIVQS